jgi:hypothetical protein
MIPFAYVRLALAACALLCLAGCMAGIRGAPPPPFDRDRVEAAVTVDAEEQVRALVDARDAPMRNRAMARLLAAIDLRYARFRQDLIAGRRHAGAARDALQLMANVAGGLTDSVGVKDNYLAFSALLQGGSQVYDREYLFDHTIAALISQMDANRRGRLLEIRAAMLARSLDEYPGQLALADILDYHQAGTLFGAIAGVQTSAAKQESEASRGLRELTASTMGEIVERRTVSTRIDRMLGALSGEDRIALRAFLQAKGIDPGPEPDVPALERAMATLYRSVYADRPDALIADLQAAGFTVPEN